ncbi:head maturation protease [Pseudomonas phage EL]|uniref:Virion structural protein n=1 Tax=Pseudomonas phage EL TaxID=273133 RepID=Q2Z0N9_9CAUD|nr:S80 family phage morphogenetic serine protease [Pseudomonas aeruginosa]YP_418225.1 head maturation protease [Pseudomonas phage EL]UZV40118.1 hypothetical protein [Pseudomonas phage IR-QUMS-PaBa1-GHS-2021]MBS9731059.1 hypothetical protein [Pseudomonas aeruginosa]MDH1421367.1 hypothetical protein [Pseudomonas aeruginosa]TQH48516.1 hypothetical protein FLI59_32135 [Pseudomonas aeruginosa]CAG27286.1 hypothetical protein [Pseudomonas phage EL]
MSNTLTFENTLLANSGKRGILKPMDSSGYYRINAGGFNIPNRSGITYRVNDYIRECARPGSDFDRRVNEGQMYCEIGHPPQYYKILVNGEVVRKQITDLFEWINRLRTIDFDNVCGHIRKVHWIFTGGPNDPVYNDIEVIPWAKNPHHKQLLQESLDNPDINTAFSIRTVTKPQNFGDKTREVDYWSTYDAVIEQGILRACKHLTAGLESLLDDYSAEGGEMEFTTTMEELFFICDQKMRSPEVAERYAGTESFVRVQEMLDDLRRRTPAQSKPARLIVSSSLDVFR